MIEQQVTRSLQRLDAWLDANAYCGWDPHDALNSPILKRLAMGNRRIAQALVLALKASPINLRGVLCVRKGMNPKAVGLFLSSSLRQYDMSRAPADAERTKVFAEWLVDHVSPGMSGPCWGYNFDWPNRSFFAPSGTPTVVNTAIIGMAFLDLADERRSVPGFSGARALAVARSACEFILHDLWKERPRNDEVCFGYTPLDRRLVHNASLLGAQLLAGVGARTGETALIDTAVAAARYSARRQRDDGAWLYGEGRADAWIDNFHTGYVLVALAHIGAAAGTREFDPELERGYRFWRASMFLPDGTPKYTPASLYPVDAHCVAQAVLTFLDFADRDPEARGWADRVLSWGIEHLQDDRGFFHYQIHRRYRIRIPYMRWVQAWMQRALVEWCYQRRAACENA